MPTGQPAAIAVTGDGAKCAGCWSGDWEYVQKHLLLLLCCFGMMCPVWLGEGSVRVLACPLPVPWGSCSLCHLVVTQQGHGASQQCHPALFPSLRPHWETSPLQTEALFSGVLFGGCRAHISSRRQQKQRDVRAAGRDVLSCASSQMPWPHAKDWLAAGQLLPHSAPQASVPRAARWMQI